MPDIRFEYGFLPNNPAEHTARLAVFYRLIWPGCVYAPGPKTSEEWQILFHRLLGRWRARVWELNQLGVHRFETQKIQRMRNCHPWGVGVNSYRGETVYCSRQDICPWCAGRNVSELYTRVRQILCEDVSLLTATTVDYFGSKVEGGPSHEYINERLKIYRELMRAMVRANSVFSRAAYWSLTVEPPLPSSEHKFDFCIRARLLLILPNEASDYLLRHVPNWRVYRVNSPDEAMCQKLVARVCAYPAGLLFGPAEAVQTTLNARIRLRMNEVSGELRGLPTEILDS